VVGDLPYIVSEYTAPIACFLHGPPGTTAALVSAYLEHDFRLKDPLPSGE
jgi:hypothetical protein